MPTVIFQTADGDEIVTRVAVGESAMRAALGYGVEGIDGDCGGACSCATCHVKVGADWQGRVGPPGEVEVEMLEFAEDCGPGSRLSCQIIMTDDLDGVRLKVMGG